MAKKVTKRLVGTAIVLSLVTAAAYEPAPTDMCSWVPQSTAEAGSLERMGEDLRNGSLSVVCTGGQLTWTGLHGLHNAGLEAIGIVYAGIQKLPGGKYHDKPAPETRIRSTPTPTASQGYER